MKKIIVIVFSILVLLILSQDYLLAQEQQNYDWILRWFPEGYYMGFSHENPERMKKEKSFIKYQKYFLDPSHIGYTSLCPESMQEYETRTSATLLKFNIVISEETGEEKVTYELREMNVFTYYDLETLIRNALVNREIRETEHKLEKNKIYSFSQLDRNLESNGFVACATDSGEWLVAEDLQLLRLMYKSGRGDILSVIDDSKYDSFIRLIPELGQYWSVYLNKVTREAGSIRSAARPSSSMYEKRLEEENKRGIQLYVNTYYCSGDEIIYRLVCLYGDEDYGKKHHLDRYSNPSDFSKLRAEYMSLVQKYRKEEWDNEIYTMTLVYEDRKLLELEKESREQMSLRRVR